MRYFEVQVVVVAGDNAYESVSRSKTPQLVLCFPSKSGEILPNSVDGHLVWMVSLQPRKSKFLSPGQKQPAFVGANVGNVCDPRLIGLLGIKILLEVVLGNVGDLATFIAWLPVANLCFKSFLFHQSGNTVPATGLTLFTQVLVDLTITIDATAFKPELLDESQQSFVILLAR